jgi:hypothetical protein
VPCEHCSAVGINFAEGNGTHSGSLKSETESADAAEEFEHIQSLTCSFVRLSEPLIDHPFGDKSRVVFCGCNGVMVVWLCPAVSQVFVVASHTAKLPRC